MDSHYPGCECWACVVAEIQRLDGLEQDAPRLPQDPDCAGPGRCHGSLSWCAACGSVRQVCDADPTWRCNFHYPLNEYGERPPGPDGDWLDRPDGGPA